VFGLRGRINEGGDFLITAMPSIAEVTVGSSGIAFPHIVDGEGYTTQFNTFAGTSKQPGSGNLKILSEDGTVLNLSLRDEAIGAVSHGRLLALARTFKETLFDSPPSGGPVNTVIFTVRSP
jgi:hypothetical protein